MPATTKKVVNPEKEMRGKKPYHRHADGAQKKKSYQAKPKKLDQGEVPEGAAALKKKLRDTLRLLGKSPKMPADLRLEHERRIEALKLQIADKHVDMTEQKMQTKYRMLKFIESKKADRKINVYKKQHPDWENNPDEKAALGELELDLAYVRHFPKTMKYISLYPNNKDDNEDDNNEDEEATTEESRKASDTTRDEIREQIREGLASGDIQQFVKRVREEVKAQIVKKENKLTTEEAVKLTAEKMNKSKKRSLAESDNPQLAARAKATAEREETKEEEEVEEESFFEAVPKVVPMAELKKSKKEETKKEGPAAKKAKTNVKQEVQETKAPATATPAAEGGETKKLGKWAKKALRAQQTFAAAAASETTEASTPESTVTASEPEKKAELKEAEKKTPEAKKVPEPKKAAEKKSSEVKKTEKKDVQVKKAVEPKKTEKKKTEKKKTEKKDDQVKNAEVAPKISTLKVDASDRADSDSDNEDEKPTTPVRPVVKVDETLLKEIPEVPRKRGGRNQKAYVEKPKIVEAPRTPAAKVETIVVKRESNDSSSEDEKPAEPFRKAVKVDETLLKELPEVPKKRGGRNLNKYKK